MSSLTDPANARRIAARIGEQADDMRHAARQIAGLGATTRWESTAAQAFRQRLHESALQAHQCARLLDAAADAFHRHADRLAAALAHQGGS